jgi:two-component system cell cycle sensor histidine kinase/response regulator CckA
MKYFWLEVGKRPSILAGMSGGENYERLKEIDPGIEVLFCSGYDMNSEGKAKLEQGCNGFIQKPFNMTDLSEKLRQIFEKGQTITYLQIPP